MGHKPSWSKKYHFPGCQNGKDDIKFVPLPKPELISFEELEKLYSGQEIKEAMNPPPLSWNVDGIKMTPISTEVFKDAKTVLVTPFTLAERSCEIFSASAERQNDRASWISAIQHIGRLTIKKHQHGGQTIIVVTPFTLK